jgi:hypothetical protein
MAKEPVLKTGARKGLWVRVPPSPHIAHILLPLRKQYVCKYVACWDSKGIFEKQTALLFKEPRLWGRNGACAPEAHRGATEEEESHSLRHDNLLSKATRVPITSGFLQLWFEFPQGCVNGIRTFGLFQ